MLPLTSSTIDTWPLAPRVVVATAPTLGVEPTARKIEKEVENFYYDMITRRMSAEAAKEQAAAMVDKIAKDYELGKGHLENENQKNLREWIFGGIDQMSEIIGSLSKFKQAQKGQRQMQKQTSQAVRCTSI